MYGESFVEEGIASSELADGWAVSFARFAVGLGSFELGGVPLSASPPVDVSLPSDGRGHLLGTLELPVGDYDDARFVFETIAIEGTATRGAERKTFSWSFAPRTTYLECEASAHVKADETSSFEITIHADHLFYDSLVSGSPALRFQHFAAADLDADGEVTRDELAATDIGPLDAGSAGGVNDLWTWLSQLARMVGHVNGEGHCSSFE